MQRIALSRLGCTLIGVERLVADHDGCRYRGDRVGRRAIRRVPLSRPRTRRRALWDQADGREIGSGSGLFTRSLATRCAKLIANDLEPRYLARTRSKSSDLSHVRYLVGDARDLRLEGVADVIALIFVLPEIPEPSLARHSRLGRTGASTDVTDRGAGCEDRTRHLMITNQVLYQLS